MYFFHVQASLPMVAKGTCDTFLPSVNLVLVTGIVG